MDREQAKALLPIIKAFSEGKIIEYRDSMFKDDWKIVKEIPNLSFGYFEYRIKPEPKYRPFKDATECWQEMQKHQPFGYVKIKKVGLIMAIAALEETSEYITLQGGRYSLDELFCDSTFADGTPFGIKDE